MGIRRNRWLRAGRAASPLLLATAFALAAPVGAGADDESGRAANGSSAPASGLGLWPGSARALKIATLDLPQPIGTGLPEAPKAGARRVVAAGGAIVTASLGPISEESVRAAAVAAVAAQPVADVVHMDPVTGPAPADQINAALTSVGHSTAGPADLSVTAPLTGEDDAFAFPPPLVLSDAEPIEAPMHSVASGAYLELALDLLLELPLLHDAARVAEAEAVPPELDAARRAAAALAHDDAPEEVLSGFGARSELIAPVPHQDPEAVFSRDPVLFPALAFEYAALAAQGYVPHPAPHPAGEASLAAPDGVAELEVPPSDGIWPSPAQRLELGGDKLARAQKCLAEAIYFESRGEPKRGQIAVAQVIVNRVFSGYYPADICGAVYQNAHRHLACQFTFACDNVRDVVREPDMWVQAKEIAADMLEGKLWLASIGRATHYHAYWVNPSWVREMRKLDKIGVHTFYRPRRWGDSY